MDGTRVFTTGDVAGFCSVTKETVARWVDRGELPAHQLPGRGDRRIAAADLLAFLRDKGFPIPGALAERRVDVVVVEDDRNAAKAIQRVLARAGLRVEVAHDGFTAGATIEHLRPALVTLDLMMPGMSGLEVLAFLRGHESLRGLKILVVSALQGARLSQALAAGADDALSKPFRNADLLARVQGLLGRTTGSEPRG